MIIKTDDDPIILKEKEIYNELVDKEKEKTEKLDDNVDTSRSEFKVIMIMLLFLQIK